MIKMKIGGLYVTCILLMTPVCGFAEMNMQDIVKRTISSNPEVLASWEAFQESTHEQRAGEGGYLPRVDLHALAGAEHNKYPHTDESYSPAVASLTLRQMLFDGKATPNEVARLEIKTLTSYYEVLQASEESAFEAIRAYADVLRFRELLDYANQNDNEHQMIFNQVKKRVDSGVGRGVDLEQAKGRLALANSNRITEENNLHDVTARFFRIVGELPNAELAPLPSPSSLAVPPDAETALNQSLRWNPGFNAAIENVRAAQKARDVRKASYAPKVDFLASYDIGDDRDEIDGHSEKGFVGLDLTYNLYRGGSDLATVRQYSSRLNRARKLREEACRNLRQTVSISYPELHMIESQLVSLKQHEDSIAKARIAYHNQYDIGQRTLLDLLDSENEYFRARRAHTISIYDYFLAHAETLSGMGQLLTAIGVRQENLPAINELGIAIEAIDPIRICPVEAVPEALYMWTEKNQTDDSSKGSLTKQENEPLPDNSPSTDNSLSEDRRKPQGLAINQPKPAHSEQNEIVPVQTVVIPVTKERQIDELAQWATPKPRRYSDRKPVTTKLQSGKAATKF